MLLWHVCLLLWHSNIPNGVLVGVVVIAHPAVILHMGSYFVVIPPAVLIAELSMIHLHVAITLVQAEHLVSVLGGANRSIVIGSLGSALMVAL